jgi:hypothetical protein
MVKSIPRAVPRRTRSGPACGPRNRNMCVQQACERGSGWEARHHTTARTPERTPVRSRRTPPPHSPLDRRKCRNRNSIITATSDAVEHPVRPVLRGGHLDGGLHRHTGMTAQSDSSTSSRASAAPITITSASSPIPKGGWQRDRAPTNLASARSERRDQTRSNRSRFMTLSHAATKSRANFSCESEHA